MKILRRPKYFSYIMPAQLRRLLHPQVAIGATAVVALIASGYTLYSIAHVPAASYSSATRGPLVETVDTTGTVVAATSVDLSFQTSGRISYAGPLAGQHVAAGATLATLSAADLAAQLDQAKANLAMQQAKLTGLESGARPEDIALSETTIASASSSLTQAKQGVVAAANDAYQKADDAVHNKVDQFVTNPRSASPTIPFTLNDAQLAQSFITDRLQIEQTFTAWQAYRNSLPSDPDLINTQDLTDTVGAYLKQVSTFLDESATVLTSAVPNTAYPLATIQGYQASVAAGRAAVSADVSALNNAEVAEKSAEAALTNAQSQLLLKQAPASASDIAAQQATIASAQAAVELAQAQLGKTVISAPFSGTITVNNANLGATASPGVPLISMNSDAQFQMDVYVSDADVAKIKPQDSAQVTLDAYSDTAFPAHVVSIDPAPTVQNGASAYRVVLQFDQNDSRILSGLGGAATITTQSKQDALSVPSSAVITRGNGTYVLKHTGSGDVLTPVTTGIVGNGVTEIVSGLNEGDEVRSFGTNQ